MSDGAREKKRVKLTLGMPSKNGTPQGSRSGSPEVPNVNAAKAGGSRAGSPGISLSFLSVFLPRVPSPHKELPLFSYLSLFARYANPEGQEYPLTFSLQYPQDLPTQCRYPQRLRSAP